MTNTAKLSQDICEELFSIAEKQKRRIAELEAALSELAAVVRGECPSLLGEDYRSGQLGIEVDKLLTDVSVTSITELKRFKKFAKDWCGDDLGNLDHWVEEYKNSFDKLSHVGEVYEENVRLKGLLNRAVDIIENHAWTVENQIWIVDDFVDGYFRYCPECECAAANPHTADCAIGKLLKEVEDKT